MDELVLHHRRGSGYAAGGLRLLGGLDLTLIQLTVMHLLDSADGSC